jgi:hypothetical protein
MLHDDVNVMPTVMRAPHTASIRLEYQCHPACARGGEFDTL